MECHGRPIMTKSTIRWLIVADAVIGFNASGWAQDIDPGKTAYMSSCAPCHGTDAKGSGVFSVELKLPEPPPPLTGLAKRNGGVFPAHAVFEIINGGKIVDAHGTREMPIWGFDVMVQSRAAAIVDYLTRIQEK
jgi:mono/diheme cytochrome c family protein